jgi:hypothetical protein
LVIRNGIFFAPTLDIVDFVGGILPFRSVQHTESVTWKGANHMKWMQRNIVALLVAGALSLGLAGSAAAQVQDGLVNVMVGDVTILQDVNIGVAALVVATICDVKVGPVAILGRAVDLSGAPETVCTVDTSRTPIIITQN